MIKTIKGSQVTEFGPTDLAPGMLTHDGVILGIDSQPNGYFVDTPHTIIHLNPTETLQVYARLDPAATEAVLEAFAR